MAAQQSRPYEYVIDRRESGWREFVTPVEIEFHQKEFLSNHDARRESRLHISKRFGVEN